MQYKDIKDGFAYLFGGKIVKVMRKNAGWVAIENSKGYTKRVRASDLSPIESDPNRETTTGDPTRGEVTVMAEIDDKPAPIEVEHVPYLADLPTKAGDYDADELRAKVTSQPMKINGHKYRVRFLKVGDVLNNRCMFRAKESNDKFRPLKSESAGIGQRVYEDSFFEYIEILSKFYHPEL